MDFFYELLHVVIQVVGIASAIYWLVRLAVRHERKHGGW